MRLSFPDKEHEDALVGSGNTLIGTAANNNIVLDRSGVAAHHVRLHVGEAGCVLFVLDATARTHVNMRPVREKALLRLGDVVSLDTLQFVLKPDRDEDIRAPTAETSTTHGIAATNASRAIAPRVLLRGVSGNYFGKIVAVRDRLSIGRGPGVELVLDESEMAARHATVDATDTTIVLRDLGSVAGTAVNGVQVRDAILYAGDQLAFGRHRFVVEAPGRHSRATFKHGGAIAADRAQLMDSATLPGESADAAPTPEQDTRSEGADNWWLIVAAALIAAAIAWILFKS